MSCFRESMGEISSHGIECLPASSVARSVTHVPGLFCYPCPWTAPILALTEGRPLAENRAYDLALQTLAQAYGATHTAGHRLLSLATDIARYWRTLRIDYKYKVDEEG